MKIIIITPTMTHIFTVVRSGEKARRGPISQPFVLLIIKILRILIIIIIIIIIIKWYY